MNINFRYKLVLENYTLVIVPQRAHGEGTKNAVGSLVNDFFGLVVNELFLLQRHKRTRAFV